MKTVLNRFSSALAIIFAILSGLFYFTDLTVTLPTVAVKFIWPFANPFTVTLFSLSHVALAVAPLLFIVLTLATKRPDYPIVYAAGLCGISWLCRLIYFIINGGSWKIELIFLILCAATVAVGEIFANRAAKLLPCLLFLAITLCSLVFGICSYVTLWVGGAVLYPIAAHTFLFAASALLYLSAEKMAIDAQTDEPASSALPDPQGEITNADENRLYETLEELKAKLEKGEITQEEYEAAKKTAIWQE